MKKIINTFTLLLLFNGILLAQPPWTVNPKEYLQTMTIIGTINIDGVESTDPSDMIAAFIDGQCRGVSTLKEFPEQGRWIFFLTVYSNESLGEISFQLYDSSNDDIRIVDSEANIQFEVNGIIGSIGSVLVISDPLLNQDAELLSISFDESIQVGDTRKNGNTFTIDLLSCTNVTALAPVFTAPDGAKVRVNNSIQTSGSTQNNFQGPVIYEVTSEDESFVNPFTVKVNLINVKPWAILMNRLSVPENEPQGSTWSVLGAKDENTCDNHTFELVNGIGDDDNFAFEIVGNELKTAVDFDFEQQSQYRIRLRTNDGNDGQYESSFTLQISNVNDETPVIENVKVTVSESEPVGADIHTLVASDKDAGSELSFEIVDGIPASKISEYFYINSNTGAVRLQKELDIDDVDQFTLNIRVSDQIHTATAQLEVNVTRVNSTPDDITLSQTEFEEGAYTGQTIAELSTFDADEQDTHTWSLVRGEGDGDNYLFRIEGNYLISQTDFDFEEKQTCNIRIQVDDGFGGVLQKKVQLVILNVNDEVPVVQDAVLYLGDDTELGAVIHTVIATDKDSDAKLSYDIASGNDGTFEIDSETGDIALLKQFDVTIKAEWSLDIKVSDNDFAHETSGTVQIIVTKINHIPTDITLSNNEFDEDIAFGALLSTLQATDANDDDTHIYNLVNGTGAEDNIFFSIRSNKLYSQTEFDYAKQQSYSIRVQTNDLNGGTFEKVFELKINNLDLEPPVVESDTIYISEEVGQGDVIHTIKALDPDSDTNLGFLFTSGNKNNAFVLNKNTGDILVAGSLDADNVPFYDIEVSVSDGKHTSSAMIKIIVTDINYPPNDIIIDVQSFNEGMLIGDPLTVLSALDKNSDDAFQFSFVDNNGTNDNQYFSISNDTLFLNTDLDFESKSSYIIDIQVDDGNGGLFSKLIQLSVIDIEPDPELPSRVNIYFADTTSVGTVLHIFTSDNFNEQSDIVWTIEEESKLLFLEIIDTTGALILSNEVQSEITPQTQFRLIATDNILTDTITVNVFIAPVNFAPLAFGPDVTQFDESVRFGDTLAVLRTIDPDPFDKHSYALTAYELLDNVFFDVKDSFLVTRTDFDYEQTDGYTIELISSDGKGGILEETFALHVTNLNDEVPVLEDTTIYIGSSTVPATNIVQLRAKDRDKGSEISYKIIDESHPGSFALNTLDGTISTKLLLQLTEQNPYTLTVESSDGIHADTATLKIVVYKDNSPPSDIVLSNNNINENNAPGFVIGYLSAVDIDETDVHSFYTDYSSAENDNFYFRIIDSALIMTSSTDYELKNQFTVFIKTDDKQGGVFVKEFTIKVNDTDDEAPVIDDVNIVISDTVPAGTIIEQVIPVDPDTDTGFEYAIISGNIDGLFALDESTGQLSSLKEITESDMGLYTIKISVSDGEQTGQGKITISIITFDDATKPDVTVTSGINQFTFGNNTGSVIVNAHTQRIDIEVGNTTDISSLIAEYQLSEGIQAYVNGLLQTPGETENDFSQPVNFTLVDEDGNISEWLVVVSKKQTSALTEIIDFWFPEQTDFAIINSGTRRIEAFVSPKRDFTQLIPGFILSDGANASIDGFLQLSEQTANDFSKPLVYTITAEDGATQRKWVVTVTQRWPAGIYEQDKVQTKCYPNPVSNELYISTSDNTLKQVKLYTVNGQLVSQQEISQSKTALNVSHLNRGTYILNLEYSNTTDQKTIIIP